MKIVASARHILFVLALALNFLIPRQTATAENVGVVWRPALSTAVRGDLPPMVYHSIASHNGNLVCVGGTLASGELNSKVLATADGLHWETIAENASFGARRDATLTSFNGRLWLMGGDDGTQRLNDVWSSVDGMHWDEELASAPWVARSGHAAVVHMGKLYLIAGISSSGSRRDVWSTTDGRIWNLETVSAEFGSRNDATAIEFQGRIWVVGGFRLASALGDVWSSSDGVTWVQSVSSELSNSSLANGMAVTMSQRMYVLCTGTTPGSNRGVWSTTERGPWKQEQSLAPFEARFGAQAVAFQNKMWIFGGQSPGGSFLDDAWWSEDGRRWENENRIEIQGANLVPHQGHSILRFRDHLWLISGSGDPGALSSSVLYSKDGLAWECAVAHAPFAGRQHQTAVVFNDKLWVIGGKDVDFMNDVWSSPDGVTWTQATAAAPFERRAHHSSFVLNGRMWVVGGAASDHMFNDIWSSADGVNWELETASAPFPPTLGHTSPIFKNRVWLIGGFNGNFSSQVWSSADGKTWRRETSSGPPGRLMHATEVFNNRLWVIGGWKRYGDPPDDNDVWSSADGVSWVPETSDAGFTERRDAKSFVQNGRLWILGGSEYGVATSEVWSSKNGRHWIKEGPHPSNRFSPKQFGTLTEFNGKLFVIGGLAGSINPKSTNDVWVSENGEDWKQVDTGTAFSPRHSHRTVVHQGRMYVIGGSTREYVGNTSTYTTRVMNDVWSTEDGENWVQETAAAAFSPRYELSIASFGGRIWEIGGRLDSTTLSSEIWSSENGRDWTLQASNAPFGVVSNRHTLVFKDHLCVFVSPTNGEPTVWYTPDGQNWASTETAGMSGSLTASRTALVDAAGELIFFEYDNYGVQQAVHSHDGITWEKKNETTDPLFIGNGAASLYFKNRIWIAGSAVAAAAYPAHDLWSSADCLRWRAVSSTSPLQDREDHSAVVFNDRIVVTGGLVNQFQATNDIWSTSDGIKWTNDTGKSPFLPVLGHTTASFGGRMWLSGGVSSIDNASINKLWSSEDGFGWTQIPDAPIGTLVGSPIVPMGGKMWFFGRSQSPFPSYQSDDYQSVWSTVDGSSWTKESNVIGPFKTNEGPTQNACAFRNRIWELAYDGTNLSARIVSFDADKNVTFSALPLSMGIRRGEAILAHANKLVVIGGQKRQSNDPSTASYPASNDVWTSSNGADWTCEQVSAPFTPRTTHTAVSFNDRIWVIGGWNSGPGYHPARDDVWSSGQGPAPQLSPASLSFGARDPENGASQPVTIRLSNPFPDAWAPIVLTGMRIEGDPSGSFSFAGEPDLRAILVGETREIDIIYTPSSTDYVTAQLVIEIASETGEDLIVPVAGGTEPLPSGAANWMMY